MVRRQLGLILVSTFLGCAATSPLHVDRIDEGVARLQDANGDQSDVPLRELPRGLREGDVVVDGRIDPEARAALEVRLKEARARLASKRVASLELDPDVGRRGLTDDPE